MRPQGRCRRQWLLLLAPQGAHFGNERLAVGEEPSVAGTQVVPSRLPVRRHQKAILGAPAIAHGPDLTGLAITGQRLQFGTPERLLGGTVQQLAQRRFPQVPQTMLGVDEVVAAVEVAIVLDDGHAAADFLKDAERVLLPEGRPNRLLEDLHFDLPDVPG